MRLYEVLSGADDDSKVLLYKPTDETYRDLAEFRARVRQVGKQYQGKAWILLPEGKKDHKVIKIKPRTQYSLDMGE